MNVIGSSSVKRSLTGKGLRLVKNYAAGPAPSEWVCRELRQEFHVYRGLSIRYRTPAGAMSVSQLKANLNKVIPHWCTLLGAIRMC